MSRVSIDIEGAKAAMRKMDEDAYHRARADLEAGDAEGLLFCEVARALREANLIQTTQYLQLVECGVDQTLIARVFGRSVSDIFATIIVNSEPETRRMVADAFFKELMREKQDANSIVVTGQPAGMA